MRRNGSSPSEEEDLAPVDVADAGHRRLVEERLADA